MENVINLHLKGQPNVMALLFVKDNEGFMYIVHNASCYASAVEAIAIKENLTPRQADDILYKQNCKKFKYNFLKSVGFRGLSNATVAQLDEKLAIHFNLTNGELQ